LAAVIVALTFDVDCQGYTDGSPRSMPHELDRALEVLTPMFVRHPQWRATWFLRIDSELDHFERQSNLLRHLTRAGHDIAWHYHGPLRQIARHARLARSRGLEVSRVGYGRGSNQTLRALSAAGFRIDSTAMPRPHYPWTRRGVDWAATPDVPYHPSLRDYRVPGTPALPILEIPISCAPVAAPEDDRNVVRYLNPAYHPSIFQPSFEAWSPGREHMVTITHPYELLPGPRHGLLAFDARSFEENVLSVDRLADDAGGCEFVTLGEIASRRQLEVASA
jgi:hypothetical protein